ncbi:MAG: glycine dehydrogenase (aminomethyl-transferring), partial [Bacteroidota bacterium]
MHPDRFERRHIGPSPGETKEMLNYLGVSSLDELIEQTVPDSIRLKKPMSFTGFDGALGEFEYLGHLREIASKNRVMRNFIGMGYHGTITPSVIARNVFHNPGWYTQYTPYQAEIAQGRLESLLNYQTMVTDLTGLPISNASLLDEGTAASEAMNMFYQEKNKRAKAGEEANEFFVSDKVYPQTIDILRTRAVPHGIKLVVGDWKTAQFTDKTFGVLLQYPDSEGCISDYRPFVEKAKANGIFVCVAADIMSLALLAPPGEWGADVAVGNTQRFGVPMGYGGPHAAYFACSEDFKRQIPGRIIGVSVDKHGNRALRMALQTREQHIRREKATSNICTAQALLANMAAMYAVYHGPDGIRGIAAHIHGHASAMAGMLAAGGYKVAHSQFFDTVRVEADGQKTAEIRSRAEAAGYNFFYDNTGVQISFDETVTARDLAAIGGIFGVQAVSGKPGSRIPAILTRESTYLTHQVFNIYHTESDMMRYIKRLENKDLSLMHSMITLGSCTMKLNAATEMMPVSWDEWANMHPFMP